MFRQLYTYLSDKALLSDFQSGFRPKHSTLSALIHMCDEWYRSMDQGNLTGVVFLDIRKAFDSINHTILLDKMNRLGIHGNQLKRFCSYLSNRMQRCQVNNCLSPPKEIVCGVPQGSILGPLLFLLYINDLPICLESTMPRLYADDTQIFACSPDPSELSGKLNRDVANISKWPSIE